MHPTLRRFVLHVSLFLGIAAAALAANAKSYQVTGPIVALTPSTITVQKDDEKWEIARDPESKGDANLKVGDRVTIYYRMTATRVEGRSEKATDANPKPSDSATKAKAKTDR